MTGYLEEYFPLVVFFGLALMFGLILMLAPLVAAVSNPDYEKNSAYIFPSVGALDTVKVIVALDMLAVTLKVSL